MCQVSYRLRHLRSSTGQLRFGTTTTCTGKPTSPSIPIGLARTVLHPHRIPDPATISLSLDSSRLHYSLVPFRFTVAYADPRVWMRSTATLASLAPLKVFTNSDSSPTRPASSIQPIFSYATIISKPRVPSLQYIPNPLSFRLHSSLASNLVPTPRRTLSNLPFPDPDLVPCRLEPFVSASANRDISVQVAQRSARVAEAKSHLILFTLRC
jgi:hypothetical protein